MIALEIYDPVRFCVITISKQAVLAAWLFETRSERFIWKSDVFLIFHIYTDQPQR